MKKGISPGVRAAVGATIATASGTASAEEMALKAHRRAQSETIG